ncbi:unnamed protein product [Owenia fusiformis]|uniref:Thyroid transcription factor 1-associated protein 26 n=1 Tax=Owenia fusiformis TaxID=6347 RepID=A0A8S4NYB2_OWEFU|nr:unnamed protein product [Owenia fusiformis]
MMVKPQGKIKSKNHHHTKGKMKQSGANIKDKRFKTYIGNQTEGQGFADKRKRKMMLDYRKLLQKEKQKMKATEPGTSGEKSVHEMPRRLSKQDKMSAFYAAQKQFSLKSQEDVLKKEIEEKRQKETQEALDKYNTRKKETQKTLKKKTHRGQPVMANRMDLLLEKIKKQS